MKGSKIISKSVFLFAAFIFAGFAAQAQLHVTAAGDVGIGTTSPSAKLHVSKTNTNTSYAAYVYDNSAPTGYKYGFYNYSSSAGTSGRYGMRTYTYSTTGNTGSAYGFMNYTTGHPGYTVGMYNYTYTPSAATSSHLGQYNYTYAYTGGTGYGIYNYLYSPSSATGTRYGIYNYISASDTTSTKYGIYSSTAGAGNYAGYFNGNVHVNGAFTQTSDERKKENIQTLSGALQIVSQLNARTYNYKQDENMNLPEGRQFGFVAQELEQVLPEVVRTVVSPRDPGAHEVNPMDEDAAAKGDVEEAKIPNEEDGEELKSVNYIALIPILVKAIQEQQEEIDALKAQLDDK